MVNQKVGNNNIQTKEKKEDIWLSPMTKSQETTKGLPQILRLHNDCEPT